MEDRTKPRVTVVGISAGSKSPIALRWAAERAARSGGRGVAVRAWRPHLPATASHGTPAVIDPDVGKAEAAARESLEADVAEVLGTDHGAEVRLVHGGKGEALLTTARELGADLIVIDTPPRTDLTTAPWFVDRVIHQAPCPVVIMPPKVSGYPETLLSRFPRAVVGNGAEAAAAAGRPGIRPPPRADPAREP